MFNNTIVFFLFFCSVYIGYSQTNDYERSYSNWFDQLIGVDNSSLYYGIDYVEKHKTMKSFRLFVIDFFESYYDKCQIV